YTDANALVLEDLSGLLDDLGLFLVIAGLRIDPGVVAEQIESVGVGHRLWLPSSPLEARAGRFHQFVHRGGTRATCSLIGRYNHALDAVLPMDRPEWHQRGDRSAVRVGNDAPMVADASRIDLWDHQRDVWIHPESGGIVDHHRAGTNSDWGEHPGN